MTREEQNYPPEKPDDELVILEDVIDRPELVNLPPESS